MIKLKRGFPWVTRRSIKPQSLPYGKTDPMREFVYLDEVSLASLLASQIGEITDNTTSQSGNEFAAEVGSSISSKNPIVPSVEINSRFQTNNSSSIQTVKKANAQSHFLDLHKRSYLRKIQPIEVSERARSVEELHSEKFAGAVYRDSELKRGDLLELKVKLSASWIFQISAMVSEFSDMFDESPTLFMKEVNFFDLYQAKNVNKVISKLMAGLIPVDGVVSDYVVLCSNGEKIIVHSEVINGLNIETHPLRIVGVTEHLAYWKDIRRILFAENEFTVLCRLSQSSIQSDWNPIKAADIFSEFAPGLSQQIERTTRDAMLQSTNEKFDVSIEPAAVRMSIALARYKDCLLKQADKNIDHEKLSELDRWIAELPVDGNSAEGQRAAFAEVRRAIVEITGHEISPSADLEARETVRTNLNLPLFAQPNQNVQQATQVQPSDIEGSQKHLLDVEFVAIYW